MLRLSPILYCATLLAVGLATHAAAQSDPANFTTVIDLPPDVAPTFVDSDTQVNVLTGGVLADHVDAGLTNGSSTNIEVNVLGGEIGNYFDVYGGATVNLVEGSIGWSPEVFDGARLNVLGGDVNGALYAQAGSVTTMTDGKIHQLLGRTGSTINISGGYVSSEFSIIGWGAASDPPTILNLSGGSLPWSFEAINSSIINISDGFIGRSFQSRPGSVVNLSGGRIYSYYDLEGELNMTGGSIGWNFEALPGAVINASSGFFESNIEIDDGATANLSGTPVRGGVLARGGSMLRISGGSFGDNFILESGAMATLVGGEFQIDGVPVAGLDTLGNQVAVNVPDGSVVSGTFEDGTPFAFSTGDQDTISEVTLEAAPLPAVGPAVITASTDEVPLGIRSGQTLNVDDGSGVLFNFVAGPGSTMNVSEGGRVRNGSKAIGATVNVTGGEVEYGFDAMLGTTVEVSGGEMERVDVFDGSTVRISGDGEILRVDVKPGGHLDVAGGKVIYPLIRAGGTADMTGGKLMSTTQNLFFEGGTLDVSGGQFAGIFSSLGGGEVLLQGGEFMLDGEPVTLGPSAATPVEVPDGSVFTGVLADGSPFAFSSLKGDRIGVSSLAMVPTELPTVDLEPIVVSEPSELTGLRAGQTMIIEDGGSLGDHSVLHQGSSIHLRGNGSIGVGTVLVGASLNVEAGGTGSVTLLSGSELTVRGEGETREVTLYGSHLNVNEGGSAFYTFLREGSHARITGGEVSVGGRGFPINVESSSSIEFSGGARTSGIVLQDGTSGVVAGGEVIQELDALAGSELEIVATEFLLDGVPIADLDPGESLLLDDRQSMLSGTYVGGGTFSFDLSGTNNNFRRDYFDPNAVVTLTRILAGDFDGDGIVGMSDYAQWRAEFGTTVDAIGDGADGNYDGIVNAADYVIWRDQMGSATGGNAVVPEPVSMLLLASMAMLIGICSRETTCPRS